MATFPRCAPENERVVFYFPPASGDELEKFIFEAGEIASQAGQIVGNPNPARLFSATVLLDDGTTEERTAGFSVPQEIADDVQAELIARGHMVR